MSRLGLSLGLTTGSPFSPFDPLSLNPILAYEASRSMLAAGDVAASNLDLVASLENRVSGGANATQTTASKQPRAHVPVGDGHLYLSGVSGNYASVPDADNLEGFNDFTLQVSNLDISTGTQVLLGKWGGGTSRAYVLQITSAGKIQLYWQSSTTGGNIISDEALSTTSAVSIRVTRLGSDAYFYVDYGSGFTQLGSTIAFNNLQLSNGSGPLYIGSENSGASSSLTQGIIGGVKIWNTATPDVSTPVLDIDFSDGDHKAASFTCASGQTVTVNKGSTTRDAATIVRRPFLRFDGADNFMSGLFNQTFSSGGYMFVAFSVNYGSETYARVFAANSTDPDEPDYNNPRGLAFSLRQTTTDDVGWYYNNAFQDGHNGTYDKDRGAVLHELKAIDGEQVSKVNNADAKTKSLDLSGLSSEKFTIGGRYDGNGNASIDLEYLYLFDETLTDDEATKVRDYINSNSSIF